MPELSTKVVADTNVPSHYTSCNYNGCKDHKTGTYNMVNSLIFLIVLLDLIFDDHATPSPRIRELYAPSLIEYSLLSDFDWMRYCPASAREPSCSTKPLKYSP